jgi:XTP/dITP diphosphohydrolase
MQKLDVLLFGTRNEAKRRYYLPLLEALAHRVQTPEQLGIYERPEEPGATAEENAAIKARFYANRAGVHAIAEDEMLFVDFLPTDRQPGPRGRRLTGSGELDDDALLEYWISLVTSVPEAKRTGRWHAAYCLASPEGTLKTIALDYPIRFFLPPSAVRIPGWPLSSIQGRVAFGKPDSELTQEERERRDPESNLTIVSGLLNP